MCKIKLDLADVWSYVDELEGLLAYTANLFIFLDQHWE